VIVARRDVPTSYHLSVVLDDALQGVTHVVRGADLLAATDVHRVLQTLLGLPAPLYHHHALLLDEKGRKLAKSESATPLRSLRAQGVSPTEVRRRLGFAAAGDVTETG
jgi:glutamyl-Q tRNA(Asp) synthetase